MSRKYEKDIKQGLVGDVEIVDRGKEVLARGLNKDREWIVLVRWTRPFGIEYVTWREGIGGVFYSGHYFTDETEAYEDYAKRIGMFGGYSD